MIRIEIENVIEVARRESRWGGLLATLAPEMIKRKVYETVAARLRKKLDELGLEVQVTVDLEQRLRD